MKASASLLLAASALATAQVTYNETTGVWTCDRPNVAYCAGDSLGTDIIIRCDASAKGQPGRCSNNLAGQPPVGVSLALCYQTSPTAGDAACEKNCVVYAQPSFTLPSSICTPTATATGSQTTLSTTYVHSSGSAPITTRTYVNPSQSGHHHRCNSTTAVPPPPITTGTGAPAPTNGTCHHCGGNNSTRTPVPPTSTRSGPTTIPTAGAAANHVGAAGLAVIGLVAAYLL